MSVRILPFLSLFTVTIGVFFTLNNATLTVLKPSIATVLSSHDDYSRFIESNAIVEISNTNVTPVNSSLLVSIAKTSSTILKPTTNLKQLIADNKKIERNNKLRRKQMRRFIDRLPYLAKNKNVKTFFAEKDPSEVKQSVEAMLQNAQQYKGTPYLWGGTTTKGFDCSGFTCYAYQFIGIHLPHSSHNQSKLGNIITLKEAQPGDMVFFGKKAGETYKTNHTGIVIENKNGRVKVIHSSRRGVVVDNIMNIGSYNHKFLFAKRIL